MYILRFPDTGSAIIAAKPPAYYLSAWTFTGRMTGQAFGAYISKEKGAAEGIWVGVNPANYLAWVHVACTFDDQTGEMSIFVNGKNHKSHRFSGDGIPNSESPLFVCGRCEHTGWDAPPTDVFVEEFIKASDVAETLGIKLFVSGMRLDT